MSRNWNPFFALENTRSEIDKAIESKLDVEQSTLNEDLLFEMQEVIQTSLESNVEIEVTYFRAKRNLTVVGIVSKYDNYTNTIYINDVRIEINNILGARFV